MVIKAQIVALALVLSDYEVEEMTDLETARYALRDLPEGSHGRAVLDALEAAEREVARLREALLGLEWYGPVGSCPVCDEFGPNEGGHKEDCWLRAALEGEVK